MSKMSKRAAYYPHQMIFNNDGDDAWRGDPNAPLKESFLDARMNHVGDSGVNSVFYCTTQGINLFTHDSQLTEVFTSTDGDFKNNRMAALIKEGTDPLKLTVAACRERGIEVFWTLRMNDWHDNFFPSLLPQWKKDHRDLLFADEDEAKKYPFHDPRYIWTPADFARKEVRELIVRIIADVLDRYDVDGIDLDFLRSRWYFKESRLLEPVTQEHMDMLTDLVGKIRQEVLATGKKKGKPILLSARVYSTAELARHFGTDVEHWLKEDYLDLLVVGGHCDASQMNLMKSGKDLVDRGHACGIPVYICISGSDLCRREIKGSHLADDIDDLSDTDVAAWRGAAANAWHVGADGIMTFNLFPDMPGTKQTELVQTIWRDISNPETLAGKDKLFRIENLAYTHKYCFCAGQSPWEEDVLPVDIEKGDTAERILMVGDDMPARKDRVRALRLRIRLDGLQDGDNVVVKMNDTTIEASSESPEWLASDVLTQAMKAGRNVLSVTFADGGAKSLTMTAAELTVHYR